MMQRGRKGLNAQLKWAQVSQGWPDVGQVYKDGCKSISGSVWETKLVFVPRPSIWGGGEEEP